MEYLVSYSSMLCIVSLVSFVLGYRYRKNNEEKTND